MVDQIMDFPSGKYSIIYADPPWSYGGRVQINPDYPSTCRSDADRHYSTMTMDALKALPVQSIAEPDSLLFLWVTSPLLDEGIEVGKAWGFKWTTIGFVWDKQRENPGNYTMSQCEICAVMKRGRIPKPRGARNIRQFLSEHRTAHSAKPAEIRNRITAMFPTQSKIELFARNRAEGWDSWGNELNESNDNETKTDQRCSDRSPSLL